MAYTDFDKRMKENYEFRSRTFLTRRIPVIIRVDGKAFHTFCRRFERPYDETLNISLNCVMKYLCENIQGAKLASRHSDEISVFVTDYDNLQTEAYFDYNIQKICSVVSSMATAEFCRRLISQRSILDINENWPNFDCRCFNIPKEEVLNYFVWRISDAKRNSINMLAQSKYSHNQLQGKSCDEKQEMLFKDYGINWNNISQGQKVGYICKKAVIYKEIPEGPEKGEMAARNVWEVCGTPKEAEQEIRLILDGSL